MDWVADKVCARRVTDRDRNARRLGGDRDVNAGEREREEQATVPGGRWRVSLGELRDARHELETQIRVGGGAQVANL